MKSPPGNPIYFDNHVDDLNDNTTPKDEDTHIDSISVFQVDGALEKLYC